MIKHIGFIIVLVSSLTFLTRESHGFNILQPNDPIVAIDLDRTIGSDSPANEAVEMAIDGDVNTKYLNFGDDNTGFIATLTTPAAVQSFILTTANDAPERDPASWILSGTNETITTPDHSNGREQNWTVISMGDLTLPEERFTAGDVISFANGVSYSSYKMTYPTTRDPAIGLMQIAEVEFYSSQNGMGTNLLTGVTEPNIIPIRDVEPLPSSNSPDAEGPENAIDRLLNTKYLNFGEERSGLIVTPSFGASVINGLQISTANDFDVRDPTSYELYGTNEAITTPNNGIGDEQNWTLISTGALDLPVARNTEGPVVPISSSTAYTSYRVIFPTVRDAGAANSMQISEIALLVEDEGTLEVNRQTGEVVLQAVVPLTLESYEIRSPNSAALDESNWSSISSTNADNEPWMETSTGEGNIISEEDGPGGANDGFTVAAGGSYSFGSIWGIVPTEFEDLSASFFGLGDSILGVEVQFVGDEIPMGDYSGNGSVGIEDWPAFRANYGSDNTGMTLYQSYLNSDLDGDFDSDIHDFNLFVAAAGGAAALFGNTTPEPSSLILLLGAAVAGLGFARSRKGRRAVAAVAIAGVLGGLSASDAYAQTFTNVGGTPVSTSIPADQMNETAESGPDNFFDDDFLDDPGIINGELFLLDYNDPTLQGGPFLQYAGLGGDPKTVFFDYGSSVSANWFAYSQRSGADPTADRVGKFEFWFSNTDFMDVVPTTEPDAVVELLPTDNRLRDSAMRPYSLSGTQTGRYVAMRLTVSELSADQPVNNIGGHEFRLLSGPSDVVLEADRSSGALTLRNNLAGSTNIEMKSYTIESPSGALDPTAFNGVRGDSGAFPSGNGSGNGWEIGEGSNVTRLTEGYFNGESILASGATGLSLGAAYNELTLAEDLFFTWTNSMGNVFSARVEYVGTAPDVLPGDYNDDGVVDSIDYSVWREALNSSVSLPNDPTPGVNDSSDFDRWRANFGASNAGSISATPEPASMLLMALGLFVLSAKVYRH